MPLLFHDSELNALMQDFYVLTGIRIILFDESYNEIAYYPPFDETFCALLRNNHEFDEKCRECDRISFDKCKKTQKLDVYKCHAGLIDATAPIMDGERIIGYMMFGQITDDNNRTNFTARMLSLCKKYGVADDAYERISTIEYRSERQILAASRILDALTVYIQLREIVTPSGKQLIDEIERFIDAHISEEIDISRLCREFSISRTRLYEQTGKYIGGGIAAYIRKKRLEYAKNLIRTTDMSVSEISDAVGFSDYNYFLRIFKQEFGMSPRKIAKLE